MGNNGDEPQKGFDEWESCIGKNETFNQGQKKGAMIEIAARFKSNIL